MLWSAPMKLWILQPDCETSPYPLSASNVYAHRAKDQPKFHYRKLKTLEDECKKHLVEIKDTETKPFSHIELGTEYVTRFKGRARRDDQDHLV